jgi:hypothetical protein
MIHTIQMLKLFFKHLIHNIFLVMIAVVVTWALVDIIMFIVNDLINTRRMGFVTYCTFIVVVAVVGISISQASTDSKK